MSSFLNDIAQRLLEKHSDVNSLICIVPSQRAKLFLKKALLPKLSAPAILPQIYSIETFIESISGLIKSSNTELIFELYKAYSDLPIEHKEDFSSFLKWGQLLLNDFNEIDNYLAPSTTLFNYVIDIHKIQKWGLDSETTLVKNYLEFWNHLPQLYNSFTARLLLHKNGYPGLLAKQAFENIEEYIQNNSNKRFSFIGFNALSTSEANLIQTFLKYPQNDIYWDLDSHFLNDKGHNAAFYIQKHQSEWPYFKENQLQGISNHFLNEKHIEIIGISGAVAQSKQTSAILKKFNADPSFNFEKTAIVLADEALLNPILNALPNTIPNINITMGYPLKQSGLASFFSLLFEIHDNYSNNGWYYRTAISLLSNPYTNTLLFDGIIHHAQVIIKTIHEKNNSFLKASFFQKFKESNPLIELLFKPQSTPKQFIENALSILLQLKEQITNEQQLEQLYRFYQIFNQVKLYAYQYAFLTNLKALQRVYQELLTLEKLDFRGEPVSGLQIMGLLESRALYFETVIITSVNEGILPAGKRNNSLLPFDVRKAFGLPTHNEKDAIYAYHFFRLLQRAKNVFLLYNTETDPLNGGEKSRFLMQLLADNKINPFIKNYMASPNLKTTASTLICIDKTDLLLKQLQKYAANGFSPSALTSYIRNPIEFYKRHILGISDTLKVEEQIEANTFGTVIHDSLEALYKPFIGTFLSENELQKSKKNIEAIVLQSFEKKFPKEAVQVGKSLIVYQVLIDYVKRFIDFEIQQLQKHEIKLIALESRLSTELMIPEIPFPIKLKGFIDRIDEVDGQLRIIDYKTGNVAASEVEITDWDTLIQEYKYGKAFQLLTYAFIFNSNKPTPQIQAGIISTKQIQQGLYLFATKAHARGSKNRMIDAEVLAAFQKALTTLLIEICNPEIPFEEKVV